MRALAKRTIFSAVPEMTTKVAVIPSSNAAHTPLQSIGSKEQHYGRKT